MDTIEQQSSLTQRDRLPPSDPYRTTLHNEVHARPSALLPLPAIAVFVAVLHAGVSREQELDHIRGLPGSENLGAAAGDSEFLRRPLGDGWLHWERRTEFSQYSFVQRLPCTGGAPPSSVLTETGCLPRGWLEGIPGRTVAAIELVLLASDLPAEAHAQAPMLQNLAKHWFSGEVVASQLGGGHSWAVTDFRVASSGFERMLLVAPAATSRARVGRAAQRLVEIETYRMMALRGLPVAKALMPVLAASESQLAVITAELEQKATPEGTLLDRLISLAAHVEHATAEHSFRFGATRAYAALVAQRIAEARELALPGFQTIGEFMQRRLSPAVASVAATERRLASLSERISRASALLRTRVDIASEAQSQLLLAKLTRGQTLQLQLQSTVESLSIAAISYYVLSLLVYVAKGAEKLELLPHAEVAAAAAVPLVLWAIWRTTRRIHERLERRLRELDVPDGPQQRTHP